MPKNYLDKVMDEEKKKKPRAGLSEVVKTESSKISDTDTSAGGNRLVKVIPAERAPGIIPGITEGLFASPQSNYGQFGPQQQGRTTAYYAGQTLGAFIRNRGLGLQGTPAQSAQYAASQPGTPQYANALQEYANKQALSASTGELTPESYQQLSTDVGSVDEQVDLMLNDPVFLQQYGLKPGDREGAKEIIAAYLTKKYGINYGSKIRGALGLKSNLAADLATAMQGMK